MTLNEPEGRHASSSRKTRARDPSRRHDFLATPRVLCRVPNPPKITNQFIDSILPIISEDTTERLGFFDVRYLIPTPEVLDWTINLIKCHHRPQIVKAEKRMTLILSRWAAA